MTLLAMPKSVMTPVRSFSPAVEDYLKAIYRLESEAGNPVTTNALGGWLGVTAPSASGMLKKLDDLRLVVYVPYRGVRLSEPAGERRSGSYAGTASSSPSSPRPWGCPGTRSTTRPRRWSTPCRPGCAR